MKVLIIGAGKLGYKLAETMVFEEIDVTVIDNNPEVIDVVNEHLDVLSILGNGIDISILRELDINTYDIVVASTSNDETNTLICSLAKKLGGVKTIARIRNPEYLTQIDFIKSEMGIDHVVNPDLATAQSIKNYLLKSHNFYYEGFSKGKVQMIDINVEHLEEFENKTLAELTNFEDLLIVAISRDGNLIIPDGDTRLLKGDVVYVIGKTDRISQFVNKLDESVKEKAIENVMILGGSNIAYYLSRILAKEHINVTIVEQDKKRCEELSELLDNALVVHGDGTDINILEEERLKYMDAFVGTTGFDEENLLMAVMAKQSGVRKVISKISRENYKNIIDRLGIDAAVNPIYITTSSILKIIRGGKIISVSLLLGGSGEVTEIVLGKDVSVVGKSLKDLKLPKGVIIGTIMRDGEIIIPNGDSILKTKDRIVVFSLKENLSDLKLFFKPHKKGGILGELWHRK